MSLHRRKVIIKPVGADGAAVGSAEVHGRAGILRAVGIDYQNQPATTDVLIKENSTAGRTLFTNADSNTDIPLQSVSTEGLDEVGAAAHPAGIAFYDGLWIDVEDGDGQTSGNEAVVVTLLVELAS